MRIDNGGYPTYLSTRHGKGISLTQGKSKVMLSTVEAKTLLQALLDMPSVSGDTAAPLPCLLNIQLEESTP